MYYMTMDRKQIGMYNRTHAKWEPVPESQLKEFKRHLIWPWEKGLLNRRTSFRSNIEWLKII
jgi:hypothetical protein